MEIPLTDILLDHHIQLSNRQIDKLTVQAYVEALGNGATFPPVVVFDDNEHLYLADGFHRVAAYRFCGILTIEAEAKSGTKQDAMVYAATANTKHGKPMTQAEKREAGKRLLALTDWSQSKIARELSVTDAAVSKWASSINKLIDRPAERTVTRGGTTYQMNVENIGHIRQKTFPEQPQNPFRIVLEPATQQETKSQSKNDWHGSIKLMHGDFATISKKLESGSFDLIITDPPYSKEYLSLYRLLAQAASRLLVPGGSCLAMAGQSYLPEIMSMMGEHLNYNWIISYDTPGGQSPQLWTRKVNSFWKPVLWYTKGVYNGKWHGDKIKSDVNDNDKRFHGWGQSESGIGKLIAEFASYGTRKVLDPFVGGGTTAVICYRLKIPFVGIDIDESAIETTKTRIKKELVYV